MKPSKKTVKEKTEAFSELILPLKTKKISPVKNLLIMLALVPGMVSASERSSDITAIKEVIPEKGYMLSVDLFESKKCSKIWTKQIDEFKKNNPEVKDPDFILVHKKIKVQTCRRVKFKKHNKRKIYALDAQTLEAQTLIYEQKEVVQDRPSWYFGVYGGASFLGGAIDDTPKNGFNIGFKFGKNFFIKDNTVSLSVGYLRNYAETVGNSNPLGDYQTQRVIYLLDLTSVQKLSSNFRLGPTVTLAVGKDVSLKEREINKPVGAYFGLVSLLDLTKSTQLELNVEQKIDDVSRLSLLTNLGVRFNL